MRVSYKHQTAQQNCGDDSDFHKATCSPPSSTAITARFFKCLLNASSAHKSLTPCDSPSLKHPCTRLTSLQLLPSSSSVSPFYLRL
ncbi:unnamed protein product [Rodentolepis nana]|uniref:Ovule protein n=1 Tax=Rodentolepis nana TaxID=102285 RepID=A0A0R3TQY5_RODNA|nr:unnamed protein product [Rodentolepis nana]